MMTVLPYLVAFLAGFFVCEALRITHERQLANLFTGTGTNVASDVDAACQEWAADPEFWCNRPGCPRCWEGWGRS
ncbi:MULTISPECIES: hypothetical protein [unclassified Nonomuraea]|uniref:hypothetical protein n=1 Tax=unclassified Nonomuraea TaxID=2593643 RepID=UPI0033F31C65